MKTEEIKVIGVYLYLMDDPDDDEGFTVDPDKDETPEEKG